MGTSAAEADLHIEDIPEGVRFHVRPKRVLLSVIWNYIYLTFLAYLLFGFMGDGWTWGKVCLVIGAGLCLGTWASRPRQIVATFNRDGVHVRGAGFFAPRWVPLGDISALTWQAATNGGPDSSDTPSGLYARRGLLNTCLLPDLDAAQTYRVLRAIEAKFSWVERTPGSADTLLFADDLVRLNL